MKMLKKRLWMGAAVGAFVMAVAACGTVDDVEDTPADDGAAADEDAAEPADDDAAAEEAAADDDVFRIVSVSKLEGITWFQRMAEGVEMFNEAHPQVLASQTGPDQDDPAAQVAIVEDLIAQGVDAIIVVPNDVLGIGPVLEQAREAGIIVGVTEATALVGTGAVDFDVESFDNADFGRGFGEGLVEAMDCQGEFATSVGNLTSESHMLWLEAALEYVEETCPEMTNLTETPLENFNDDQRGREIADELLSTYPDLGGYLATTPSGTSGFASALRERGITEGIANVGLTLPSVAGPDLNDGYMDYGQGWDPAGWGWALNAVALRLLEGESIEDGIDLEYPLGGYESIVVLEDGELILGNDIQSYEPGDFADGNYPF